jgi:hypothetical protein
MQFEELGIDYLESKIQVEDPNKREELEQKLKEKWVDYLKKQGGVGTNQHKDKRGDGFLNRGIRSLTVAAYLRCLYASVEYAPTVPLRKEAIPNILDPV